MTALLAPADPGLDEHPLILFDVDGWPIAVRGHLKPIEAFRVLWDEDRIRDLLLETVLEPVWDDDLDREKVPLSEVRACLDAFGHAWFVRSETDPLSGNFGDFDEDTYWPVPDSYRASFHAAGLPDPAVPYTTTGLGG